MKRWIYILEIIVFYLALFALGHAQFFTDLFQNYQQHSTSGVLELFLAAPSYLVLTNPHPFWIGILLFAARYGIFAGLISGFTAAALYLADMWYFSDQYLFEDTEFYILPTTFVLVGILMGFTVNRKLSKIRELEHLSESQNTKIDELNKELRGEKIIVQNLERRIVSRMTTLATLYQGARNLESIHADEILDSILTFFSKTLDAEQAALYVSHHNGWMLHKSFGWSHDTEWPTSFKTSEGLVGQCAEHNRIFSLRDFLKSDITHDIKPTDMSLTRDSLIAAPIFNTGTGKVEAVYAIQKLHILTLNSATMNVLNFLCSWAGTSLARAHFFTQMKSREIIDPEFGVFSYNYFETRFKQEFMKSKKFYLPLSIGLVQVQFTDPQNTATNKSILNVICQILQSSVRDIDVIARFPDNRIPFVCLFSTSNQDQACAIRDNILSNINKLNLGDTVKLQIGVSSFTPQTQSAEQLLDEARLNSYHAA